LLVVVVVVAVVVTTTQHFTVPHFILTIFLIVLSTIGTLGQPLFQITLTTDYNTTYCKYLLCSVIVEDVWKPFERSVNLVKHTECCTIQNFDRRRFGKSTAIG